jgi:hypothetical protein
VKLSALNCSAPAAGSGSGSVWQGAGVTGSSAGLVTSGTSISSSPANVSDAALLPSGSLRNALAEEPNSLGGPAMRLYVVASTKDWSVKASPTSTDDRSTS